MAMCPDQPSYGQIYREAMMWLKRHALNVEQGKDVLAAKDFATFILWSGIPELLKSHPAPYPCEVDGEKLRTEAESLRRACWDRWSRSVNGDELGKPTIAAINHKLELIAGFLAQNSGSAPNLRGDGCSGVNGARIPQVEGEAQ